MTFYNLRTNPSGELPYTITKFTADLEVESSYQVGRTVCECPAGHRLSCRHRDMLHILTTRVDTAWFYCFETKRWEDPTGEATKTEAVADADELAEVEDAEEEALDVPAEVVEAALASVPEGASPIEAGTHVHKFIESAIKPAPTKPKLGGLRRL